MVTPARSSPPAAAPDGPEAAARSRAAEFDLPFAPRIAAGEVDAELLASLPMQFARKHLVLPLAREPEGVAVAVGDPRALAPLDDLRVLYGAPIRPIVVPPDALIEALNRAYDLASGSAADLMGNLEEERLDLIATELEEPRDLLEASDEAPIIRLVNSLLFQAVKDRASDIHIEPFERQLAVRFRVDGILYDVISPPKRFQPVIISRVKVMAGLDIAEKRLPQDGRIRTKVAGKDIDVRVSVIPTAYGERVVLRLLDRAATLLGLEELGLTGRNLALVERLIRQSHGIVLVTGPTGSGKTTTLYAALSTINSTERNIITIEDPIEYQLQGVGQMQVNPKIDLTFANGLRSILRQDPDVIMVGEIRDGETAEIAIQAALTGHLVFSTLHTNDSASAVTRLVEMGTEPFLVSSSVLAVMAQRLLRRVCDRCRRLLQPTPEMLAEVGIAPERASGRTLYAGGAGCEACKHTGYRGRTGIHELLVVDDDIRALIMKNADASAIRRAAVAAGMATLREDGADKILTGETTIEEVLRVTQDDAL
ncbi:MAG: type II secretion system protein GspE [Polyangiaceae bacterium UTPRO1]|jgi:general secretion pathway protein E|nr:type II secretion system ATPase GspE [Myxococcales bacterium]OQY68833.1 MAG: type II secretion system protein GspE [Polyangiaceae bacterium UTPRO1]